MTYVKSLDGVRCLAVLLVILLHLRYIGFGWVGVQIFFVLSGYLITAILLHDRERLSLGPYLGRFYWRRTLRIFPLYYAYLVAITVARLRWDIAPSFSRLWPYLYGYGMNFADLNAADPGPAGWFVHFWTLAIEEQFYLVWPWLVFYTSRQTFRRFTVVLIFAAPLIRFALFDATSGLWHLVKVSPLTEVDAFAAGALIAMAPPTAMRHARRWLALCLGVILVLGCWTMFVHDLPYRTLGLPQTPVDRLQVIWRNSLLNLTSALVVLECIRGRPIFRLFEHPLLVRIGRVSYGIYVLHFPMIIGWYHLPFLWRIQTHSFIALPITVLFLGVVWLAAESSYWLIEGRFIALKNRMPFHRRPARATVEESSVASPAPVAIRLDTGLSD
jgi:peptidoglycan/LPS O-acetylase OafA/YrhL